MTGANIFDDEGTGQTSSRMSMLRCRRGKSEARLLRLAQSGGARCLLWATATAQVVFVDIDNFHLSDQRQLERNRIIRPVQLKS